jgi:hypothetical protein
MLSAADSQATRRGKATLGGKGVAYAAYRPLAASGRRARRSCQPAPLGQQLPGGTRWRLPLRVRKCSLIQAGHGARGQRKLSCRDFLKLL